MWTSKVELLEQGRVRKLTLLRGASQVSFADVINGWRDSREFRDFYSSLLARAPFEAMFWESPPVTRSSIDRPYECVLVDSPRLAAVDPDPDSFKTSFDSATSGEGVVTFENLGADALLVAPCPVVALDVYTHLATFVRTAPVAQRHDLFRKLAEAVVKSLGDKPMWVSTSGLGVNWLHVRLDSSPKYYTYAPYRRAS